MVEKGMVISLSMESDEIKNYLIAKRVEDFSNGEGGWLCIDTDAIAEKGVDNISAMDCWRVSDKYLEVQIQRGVIQIAKLIDC
jgi:hypothetical protein